MNDHTRPVPRLAPIAAALLLATCGSAWAAGSDTGPSAFTGPLAPANWTLIRSGPAFGSGVDIAGAPASVTLIGGNDTAGAGCPDGSQPGFIGGCEVRYTIAGRGIYSFQWAYTTADITPAYDQFGVVVDGVKTVLTANGGDVAQSGSLTVSAASTFGWYLNCTDCTLGAARVTLSNVTVVPEAGTAALFTAGIAAIALVLRRRR